MNRHRRRAAAAQSRRTGYQHRLLAALNALDLPPGEVSHLFVEHDDDCAFEAGRCTCVPDITCRAGNRVQIIGDDGEVEEARLS